MVSRLRPVTANEFYEFVTRPENIERNFELIAGEIVEKMVSNPRSSAVGAFIIGELSTFVHRHGLGHVTGADGGYVVSGEQYIPDGAFISKTRCPTLPTDAYNPLAPDIAVEVLSPSNTDEDMRVKVSNYLAAGTTVWVVDPGKRIEAHRPGQPVQILGADDTLTDDEKLPGFTLSVSDILSK